MMRWALIFLLVCAGHFWIALAVFFCTDNHR